MCKNNNQFSKYIGIGMLINAFCVLFDEQIPHFLNLSLRILGIVFMLFGTIQYRKKRDCL